MKNQFFLLLLSCFFLLGNMSFANEFDLNGVTVAHIENGKTGATIFSFSLPDHFIDKNGKLIAPMQITLSKNGKRAEFSAQTRDLYFELPIHLSGNYNIIVVVGDYQVSSKISL